MAEDEDLLDGCGGLLDTRDFDDDETAAWRPLFPSGAEDAHLADAWQALFVGEVG